jgi:integrase
MKVIKSTSNHPPEYTLINANGANVEAVNGFLRALRAKGCSPNTVASYAYDLKYLFEFLELRGLQPRDFTPYGSLEFLEHLRALERPRARHATLSNASLNRMLAAVSSFYEHLVFAGEADGNPMVRLADPAAHHVTDRHRPSLSITARQQPIRRAVRVKVPIRLPRPLGDDHVQALLSSLHRLRDQALLLLMLQGGLRPGEALGLQLEDIQYGRRRVAVRIRDNHPKGVRSKSRVERYVDLYESETLTTLSRYVMHERPSDAASPHVFLVGGHGRHRLEPIGYPALVKMFKRRCQALGIQDSWVTPHALRHTHATRLWEGGMRELALQKRLGHASAESTKLYTRVSDAELQREYERIVLARTEATS